MAIPELSNQEAAGAHLPRVPCLWVSPTSCSNVLDVFFDLECWFFILTWLLLPCRLWRLRSVVLGKVLVSPPEEVLAVWLHANCTEGDVHLFPSLINKYSAWGCFARSHLKPSVALAVFTMLTINSLLLCSMGWEPVGILSVMLRLTQIWMVGGLLGHSRWAVTPWSFPDFQNSELQA